MSTVSAPKDWRPCRSSHSVSAESGRVWLERAVAQWPRHLWINPVPEQHWSYTQSIRLIGDIFQNRMVPMTLEGLGRAMREVAR